MEIINENEIKVEKTELCFYIIVGLIVIFILIDIFTIFHTFYIVSCLVMVHILVSLKIIKDVMIECNII